MVRDYLRFARLPHFYFHVETLGRSLGWPPGAAGVLFCLSNPPCRPVGRLAVCTSDPPAANCARTARDLGSGLPQMRVPMVAEPTLKQWKRMDRKPRRPKRRTSRRATVADAPNKAAAKRPQPWWLIADVEMCIFCHGGYAYGTGYRCAGCDAAICMQCVEVRDGQFFCSEC